LRREEQEKRRN